MRKIKALKKRIELIRMTLNDAVVQGKDDKKILYISQQLDNLINDYQKTVIKSR